MLQSEHDTEELREEINRILNSPHTQDVRNNLIVQLILKKRRKKLLQKEREALPSASENLFAGAGSSRADQPTPVGNGPDVDNRNEGNRTEEPADASGQLGSDVSKEENGEDGNLQRARDRETRDRNLQGACESDDDDDDDDDGDNDEEEEEQENKDKETPGMDGCSDGETDEEPTEKNSKQMGKPKPDEAAVQQILAVAQPPPKSLSTTFLRANENIANIFRRNMHPLIGSSTKNLLLVSQKLSDYFHNRNAKFSVKSNIVYRKSSQKPVISLDRVLAVFALKTKQLFKFVTYDSPGAPRKFTLTQKRIIRQIFKATPALSITDIPSVRVREMLH